MLFPIPYKYLFFNICNFFKDGKITEDVEIVEKANNAEDIENVEYVKEIEDIEIAIIISISPMVTFCYFFCT